MFTILKNMHLYFFRKGNGPDPKTGTGTTVCKVIYYIQIFVTYAKPVKEQFRTEKDPGPEIAILRFLSICSWDIYRCAFLTYPRNLHSPILFLIGHQTQNSLERLRRASICTSPTTVYFTPLYISNNL
jgi:hypothetical protein